MNRRGLLRIACWPWLATAMDRIEVVHTRVFVAGPGGGNPCPVVAAADSLTDAQMQGLARKFRLDTAFLLKPKAKEADLRIRYFVPEHEMGVSGHATIAAITVALRRGIIAQERVKIETINGVFEAQWERRGDEYVVALAQNAPAFGAEIAPDAAARALGIRANEIDTSRGPAQVVSVSRAKILVPLSDWRVLNRLKPDFEALWALCDAHKATGLYPFTRVTGKANVQAEARQFPLRAGFPEDAATGVAAAALAGYLVRYDLGYRTGVHEFRIAQGYAMGAPSLIQAVADCREGKVVSTGIRGSAEVVRRERVRH